LLQAIPTTDRRRRHGWFAFDDAEWRRHHCRQRHVIEQGKQAAAHFLEASVTDVEFVRGRFNIAGTDVGIHLMDVAERLRLGGELPEGMPRALDVSHVFKGVPSAFPNGCHIAEVEVDPDTGVVEIVSYAP
jgi:carbon-monoxide dehydrogenase large subunit